MKVESPVLLIIFNRPDCTRQTLNRIRGAKPAKLYVAADGPRQYKPSDAERCALARAVIEEVDWPCEVKTLFREQNLGCGKGVSGAITWFFEHEEAGIILEDDILATESFFRFCDEMLVRYANETRVGTITGNCFVPQDVFGGASYAFSSYSGIWGWATWRRVWQNYDYTMAAWPEWKQTTGLYATLGGRSKICTYWSEIFDRTHESLSLSGTATTWDYQLVYMLWQKRFLTVVPTYNLTSNIGFAIDGTHTSKAPWFVRAYPARELQFPLIHQTHINATAAIDRNIDRLWQPSLSKRLKDRLKRLANLLNAPL
jgi:hypothetical protein